MPKFEIEIKSLLGTRERAEVLRTQLAALPNPGILIGKNSQLNHYFLMKDSRKVFEAMESFFSNERRDALQHILREGSAHSVRTRQSDSEVRFVVKASIDDSTSSNGISRMEFDERLEGISLDELDKILLGTGCSYQAKWSRDREEYSVGNIVVSIDRNAGYGYVAEFERVIEDASSVEQTKADLIAFMASVGVEELPQDRLERMFAYYNEHWSEYYGTEKIFVVE